MTKRLEMAFAEASKLPEERQEAIAEMLFEEIEAENRWSEAFASSQNQLAALADEALKEFSQGKTRPFENDRDLAHD